SEVTSRREESSHADAEPRRPVAGRPARGRRLLFSLGALVGQYRGQRPPPFRTAFDVALRLTRLDPPLRVLHPAREGLSPGLYFTRTAKGLEDLMRRPRGAAKTPAGRGRSTARRRSPTSSRWIGTRAGCPWPPASSFTGTTTSSAKSPRSCADPAPG